jgi:serine/threonine-protein kinase
MDVTPRRIGPYEIEELLGEGGVGQVYAARDTLLGRRVAIKTLRPEMSRDRNLIERFYVEAKSLANLNHSNIATLYALQLDGQEACMVMELINGCTLNDLLARVHRLSLRQSLAVIAQAVAGLRYAHRRGVIHRDIKPSNLMITDEGELKIMDFGVARVLGSQQLTRTGEFYGTIAYASPEQIRADPVDERTDIYSLAIVLYRLLSGTPPFKADSDYALMTAHLQQPPPPLAERVPELDSDTEAALMRALAKQPAERFASIEEFGRAVGAHAVRGESAEILQQLYAEVFDPGKSDATRIVDRRAVPESEPFAARPSAGSYTDSRPPRQEPPPDSRPASLSGGRKALKPALLAGGAVIAIVAAGLGSFFLWPSPTPSHAPTETASAPVPPAERQLPQPPSDAAAPAAAQPESSARPSPTSSEASPPTTPEPAPVPPAPTVAAIAPPPVEAPVPTPPPATANPADDEANWSEEERREVQRGLRAFGHFTGEPDGNFGLRTRAAIKQFQSFAGEPETGLLSAEQRTSLLGMAQRLADLLEEPPVSPRKVPASAISGGAQRYARAWSFETGKGNAPDPAEAAYWYRLAAADGETKALTNLGTLLARGQGTGKPDPEAARLLWWAAAAQGEAIAMFNLGAMYERGIGVATDAANARRWYERAAAHDHPQARTALKRLGAG